jgi:hypothetical protein
MPDNVTSLFPLDSGTNVFPTGGALSAENHLWPKGGQAADASSLPLTSGASNPDYWLPIWSGEVINAYDQYNIFEPMVVTETIESGTTKRFPITGVVGHKGIWSAGEELVGDSGISTPGWFDISLDQRPMAAFFELDDIHLMLTQWDYRAELARQAGLALANVRDKQIACMIAQGAFAANRNPFGTGLAGMNNTSYGGGYKFVPNSVFNNLGNRGTGVTDTQRTDAALALLQHLEYYMVNLQEQDVPAGEVYCAVSPAAFHDIRALGIARDATGLVGGAGRPFFGGVSEAGGLGAGLNQGMFNIGDMLEYMGIKIIKSNHLAQLDGNRILSNGTGTGAVGTLANKSKAVSSSTGLVTDAGIIRDLGDQKYNFDWCRDDDGTYVTTATTPLNNGAPTGTINPVKALIWQRNAVCSLRLQGMKVETVKDVRRGTFFTVASIMGGAGILRPELCAAIQGTYSITSITT